MLAHPFTLVTEQLPAANSWIQIVVAAIALLNTVLLSLLHSRAYRRDGWRGIGTRSGLRSTHVRSSGALDLDLTEVEGEDLPSPSGCDAGGREGPGVPSRRLRDS